jgi:hypothetical protein
MTKFNYVGIQREIEALYNKYDWELISGIDYRELAFSLYSLQGYPILDTKAKSIFDRLKVSIFRGSGISGMHNLFRQLKQLNVMIDSNTAYFDRYELERLISDFGSTGLSPQELTFLLDHFDDSYGKIIAPVFQRWLKVRRRYLQKHSL